MKQNKSIHGRVHFMKGICLLFMVLFVVGCQKGPVVPVTFASGPIERVVLPSGFKVKSSSLHPWALLAESTAGQSFSLQVVIPGDEIWDTQGNLAEATKMLGEKAKQVIVNGRNWVIIPFNGIVAYSLGTDRRLYFLGQGKWSVGSTIHFLEGVTFRKK